MSKGDILEPFVEIGLRVLFPRHGNYGDEMSWPWLVGVLVSLVALIASDMARTPPPDLDERATRNRRRLLTGYIIFGWFGVLWSLFHLRFGGIP